MSEAEPKPKPLILIVDDEHDLAEGQAISFELTGCTVISFTCAEDALDWLQTNTPDIALFDWQMPRINGVELRNRIRGIDKLNNTLVIFSTTDAEGLRSLINGEIVIDKTKGFPSVTQQVLQHWQDFQVNLPQSLGQLPPEPGL